MKCHQLGKTRFRVSAVSYGGVVASKHFDKAVMPGDGQGFLCMKAMIERAWEDEERYSSKYPMSWCKPFDIDEEPEMLLAAMKYSFSLGADTLIPPGNFDHFKFAVEHIDEVLDSPLSEEETEMLRKRLPLVIDFPFMDVV